MTTYSVWSQTGGGTLVSDTASYTLGNQFATVQSVVLTGVWFYSASGAASLPSQCVIFTRAGTQVAGSLNTSPSWSGAAGSGWVKCSYNGTVTLPVGSYVVAVLGGGSNWYSTTAGYWAAPSGTGQAGESNGPLSMEPARFTDSGNQSVLNAGSSLTFPTSGGAGENFWVDVEVQPDAGAPRYTLFTAPLPPDPSGADLSTAATAGMQFGVSRTCTLTAIWHLIASSTQLPTHVGVFLITGVGTGTLVVDNSSPVLAGPGIYAWNRIPVTPTVLTPGNYVVATFNSAGASENWLPVSGSYWTSGPGSLGKQNGPLFAPRNTDAVNGNGVISSTTGSFTFPDTSAAGEQYWVDVEVVEPSVPYTLMRQQFVPAGLQFDTASYTIGVQFSVTSQVLLHGMWWYSPLPYQGVAGAGTGALPSQCVIYDLGTSSQVTGSLNTSPSWSGAAGSGWVRTAMPAVTLVPGKNYEACILGPSSAVNWYAFQQNWWSTGPGANGITNGPLTAPNSAGAVHSQSSFSAGSSLQIPTGSFNAANFFVDVEVSPLPGAPLVTFP